MGRDTVRLVTSASGSCAHIEAGGSVLCNEATVADGEVTGAMPEGGLCKRCEHIGEISGALSRVVGVAGHG